MVDEVNPDANDEVVEEMDNEMLEEIDGAVVEEIDGTVVEKIDGAMVEEIDGAVVEEIDDRVVEEIGLKEITRIPSLILFKRQLAHDGIMLWRLHNENEDVVLVSDISDEGNVMVSNYIHALGQFSSIALYF